MIISLWGLFVQGGGGGGSVCHFPLTTHIYTAVIRHYS